jgi:RNA polymerase sigma factor (sigma-70 family)
VITADPFVSHRSLLFAVGYELLGSAADAEDVLQEAGCGGTRSITRRCATRGRTSSVWSREALNRLRTLSRRREDYVGEWLPEPLLTSPDVAEDVALAESVSIAMLTVLETLGPTERAAFVLREVFATPYDEIAEAVGKSAAAVRQIARRARAHVAARQPRMQVSHTEQRRVLEQFHAALRTGELRALMEVMAPDVIMVADGGGVVAAIRAPVRGADRVAAMLAGFHRLTDAFETTTVWLNGAPAIRIDLDGELDAVVSLVVHDGRITGIYAIRNPQKLARVTEPADLAR